MINESQMETHIQSNPWNFVETRRQGSQDYDSHIGVLRVMFGISEDPQEVTTLLSDQRTEVWARYDNNWERLFAC